MRSTSIYQNLCERAVNTNDTSNNRMIGYLRWLCKGVDSPIVVVVVLVTPTALVPTTLAILWLVHSRNLIALAWGLLLAWLLILWGRVLRLMVL